MSQDSTALVALKNAWTGAVAAADRLRELEPAVRALGDATPLEDLDLEAYHKATLAHGNAAMALRGLVEQLQRRREQDADAG
jgi:hypothetical protein